MVLDAACEAPRDRSLLVTSQSMVAALPSLMGCGGTTSAPLSERAKSTISQSDSRQAEPCPRFLQTTSPSLAVRPINAHSAHCVTLRWSHDASHYWARRSGLTT